MERLGTVAIVGVGLIGGSIGLAVRARGLAGRVVGIGRDPAKLREALRLGAIDEPATDPARGVAEADVVVVCTPVSRVAADCLEAARSSPDRALITDAGSTKAAIVVAVEGDPRAAAKFCGSHPIAGSERQGAAFARADLFEGRACVVTPTDRTPADRLERAAGFWEALGGRAVALSPDRHDSALALTSHLPHVLAAAAAGVVPADLHGLAAGAFRDVTRVAAADPDLWTAIFLANRGPVLDAIEQFRDRLDTFRRLLRDGDGPAIARWWAEAKRARDLFDFDAHRPGTEAPSRGSP